MIVHDDIVVPISAIEHHTYCPRQCALIHVDGIWTDNRYTIAGRRTHRRADSGSHRQERGKLVLRSIPLWSEYHGLTGRADIVEVSRDGVIPVEYKSGTKHGEAADLQVCAQAMCLEEMLGIDVSEAFVWFGAPRRRHHVSIDAELRQRTLDAVRAIRATIEDGVLPAAPNDARCDQCQLLHHCLPTIVTDPSRIRAYIDSEVLA